MKISVNKIVMANRKSIVYLGNSGFPYGLAEIQKIIFISKSLIETGNSVTVINTKGTHDQADHPELKVSGNFEGIEFVYSSKNPFRNNSFFKRNVLKIYGIINEFLLLKTQKKNNKLDYAILSTHNFYSILYYVSLSKLFGFKTILNYAEYYPGIKKKWFQVGRWINDKLYDKYAPLLVDALFPISEFLINHLRETPPDKKYLKIPVLTDFERYNGIENSQAAKYFLFCGAANYKEIIQFTIDSFGRLNNALVLLYLIVNGNENNISEIKKYINNNPQKDKIILFSKLTEKQLNNYYKNASALLIPLRPTFQDSARFPHKIGEYLASGNPVISTNYGEVKYYFKDMENMLIADRYEINLFAEKMQFVIDNPLEVQKIGMNGKKMALPIFDYRIHASAINNFLNSKF
jgi:glycosyltransferase involved in cell wall biosynthesis